VRCLVDENSLANMADDRPLSPADQVLLGYVLDTAVDQLAVVGGTLRASCAQLQRSPRLGRGEVTGDEDEAHPDEVDEELDAILLRWNKKYQSEANKMPAAVKLLDMKRLRGEILRCQRVLETAAAALDASHSGSSTLAAAVEAASRRDVEREEIANREKRMRKEITELREAISTTTRNAQAEEAEESLAVAKLKDSLLETR